MEKDEYKILNNNKNLIVCFGGLALQMGKIPPFEFLRYLSSIYTNNCDLYFFIDRKQCWYHKGIYNVTNNIDETVIYLNNLIKNYEKIIFMGTSAGGYAAILFGSLCNVTNVISFIPQTILNDSFHSKYINMREVINNNTKYLLYGDLSIKDINDLHHIRHCYNLQEFKNVIIIKKNNCNLKKLRDNGNIKKIIDDIINN
jgi:predicted esterase YcpF (UPF0227 family)